jgi:hypothetical protein
MSDYGDILRVLGRFRADLKLAQDNLTKGEIQAAKKFGIRTPHHLMAHPLLNVHATGVGVRRKRGTLLKGEYVIKVYVYDKVKGIPRALLGPIGSTYQGVGVDVESLPIKQELAAAPRANS